MFGFLIKKKDKNSMTANRYCGQIASEYPYGERYERDRDIDEI